MHAYMDAMSMSLCLVQVVVLTTVRDDSWVVGPLSCSVYDAYHHIVPSAD